MNEEDIKVPQKFTSHINPLPVRTIKINNNKRQKPVNITHNQKSYIKEVKKERRVINEKPKSPVKKTVVKNNRNIDEWLNKRNEEYEIREQRRKEREIRKLQSEMSKREPFRKLHSSHKQPINEKKVSFSPFIPTEIEIPEEKEEIHKEEKIPQNNYQPIYQPIIYQQYPSMLYVSDYDDDNEKKETKENPPQLTLSTIFEAVDYHEPTPQIIQVPQPIEEKITQIPEKTGPQIIEIKDHSTSMLLDYLKSQMDEVKSLKQQAKEDQISAFENKMESFFEKLSSKLEENNRPVQPQPIIIQQPIQPVESKQQEPVIIQQQPNQIEPFNKLEEKMEKFFTELTNVLV